MEELGWSYDLVFKPGDLMGSMALAKAVHPMGMVPTVKIDDVIMVESGAILEYIITKYAAGRLWVPIDSPDYPLHLLWMHYAEGSASNRIVDDYMAHTIPAGTPTPMTRIFTGDAGRVLAMVERHLDAYPYFGGQTFTAADIMMYFPMHLTRNWGVDWSLYPRLGPWFEQMERRPAFMRMRARALPNGPLPSAGPLSAKLLADTGKS
jgi:glutathione S-transferase